MLHRFRNIKITLNNLSITSPKLANLFLKAILLGKTKADKSISELADCEIYRLKKDQYFYILEINNWKSSTIYNNIKYIK